MIIEDVIQSDMVDFSEVPSNYYLLGLISAFENRFQAMADNTMQERYGVVRDAVEDADALLAGAFERESYHEVKKVLGELRKKYSVFIGSNTDNNVLESVMRKNDITVDKVYTSENLKCYKPNIRFFEAILADNDFTPQDVLFVGDSISDDILGPKALGIKTVWIDRNGIGDDFGQDYTISNLENLLSISDT